MRQALSKPTHLQVVDRGHSTEKLKQLAQEHFRSSQEQFFFLIGSLSGNQAKFENEIESALGLPNTSLRYLERYEKGDLDAVIDLATNPNCVGVVAFGLERADGDELLKKLDENKVGTIQDGSGDSYAIFSTVRRIKPNELVRHLRKLLTLFFDKDHLKQEHP